MAQTSLLLRLNCREYKNWMKAGYCLQILQSRLQGFIDSEMKTFHRHLTANISRAGGPQRQRCQCRAKGKQFHPNCPVCMKLKELILLHHNNRNGEIHWGNCDPSLWPTQYWEVAKVYLPRGHTNSKGPQQCDAAAILNLINSCDHFNVSNISKVREVIKCRNDLMHSSDMKVSSSWLSSFGQKLQELISELGHVPNLKKESDQIKKVLSSDWSVKDLSLHEVDGFGAEPDGGENVYIGNSSLDGLSLNELEIQLVNQLLEEIYLEKEENGALSEEVNAVIKMKTFLTENKDLLSVFQEDLEKLEHLLN
ncbi:PREDICTED: uncharacterized protein CXorf38 homolog isoform X2 [Nanorana parkeri]|uniref:uncharacterized protein CXorf38 homolog isoform X2 n=1 Tax=Nanorana parkeri TaxID=125878 RepID=UPI0008547835|nr:PREDICTED: uncharacterized protein CXorf38 homolog isoform X2 [Nanorana parkeri]